VVRMARKKIASGMIARDRMFVAKRRPGRFSPKSPLLFIKAGPKFPVLTPQQKKVSEAGKACGAEIRGKYTGSAKVAERRAAMAACIRKKFGK